MKTVFPEDYKKFWRMAHEEAVEKSPYYKEQARRVQANWRCRANDNDGAARKHFKMVDPPVYDLVVTHWFDTMEQVGAFRQYVEAMQNATGPRFANWSQSFYLYTKQIVIIRDTPLS